MAPQGTNRLNATRLLGERIFESEPMCFQILESELDAFLAEESRYCSFKTPSNPNRTRESRKKDGARRYDCPSNASTTFKATFVSHCGCSGTFHSGRKNSVSPKKRRITGGAASSVKIKITIQAPLLPVTDDGNVIQHAESQFDQGLQHTGRPASLDSSGRLSILSGPTRQDSLLDVEYHWRHEGHAVGTISDLSRQRNPTEVKEWIEAQVRSGRTTKEIMASVRMDMDELFAIHSVGKNEMLSSTTAISASIRIRYYDVYNTVRRLKLETARKDPDALKSLQLWADTLRQEGWEAEFLNDSTLSATPEPVWVCFLMPRWSKKEFSAPSSSVWCVDSTHNTGKGATRQEKIFLTTIIVRSASMGSGIPLAFLITPSETQIPLTRFFQWLLAKQIPAPTDVMIDCSETERAAINNAFAGSTPRPRVLLCLWHLLRAWADNVKTKVKAIGDSRDPGVREANSFLQSRCRNDMRTMQRAETEEQFEEARSIFFSRWSDDQPLITRYFEKEWLSKRSAQNWARCHRKHAHYGIDTNNMVEGWHGNLKVNYLGMIRQQRVDSVLQVIVREVVPDFYRKLVQCDLGIQKPHLCGQEKKSRQKAYELSFQDLCAFVKCVHDEAYEVKSTDGGEVHVLDADLTRCSCPSFQSTGLACKHLFMCSRLLSQPIARLQKPGSTSESTAQPPTATESEPGGVTAVGNGRLVPEGMEAQGEKTMEGGKPMGEEGQRMVISGQRLNAEKAAEQEAKHQQQKEDLVQTSINEAQRLMKALSRLQADSNLAQLSRTALEQLDNEVRAARRTAEMLVRREFI